MPKTAAATKTQLENAVENPKTKASRQIVHCTLIFEGVEVSPVAIYEALDTKFATVALENDTAARYQYVFSIKP